MIIFEGTEKQAFRDPACFYFNDTYYLFFTLSEKENGYMFNYIAMSTSTDFRKWSEPRILTEKNLCTNFCSPGNIIPYQNEYILCFTSYPMPKPYAEQFFADDTARIYMMRTTDFITFSPPELLRVKGNLEMAEMGRMIDPFLLEDKDNPGTYYSFYKQNGVSISKSNDLVNWEPLGNTDGGENACVLVVDNQYLLVHSPENGIAFKTSPDLRNWQNIGDTCLNQENWDWASGRLTAGFLMTAPDNFPHQYILFFHGSKDVFPETHGNATLAVAFSDDLKTFYDEM